MIIMQNQIKQIEEMCEVIASLICEVYNPMCDEYEPHNCSHCYANDTTIGDFAEMLYNAGYRKQSEVSMEIFEEIDILGTYNPKLYDELKKKYTEEQK